MDLSAIFRSLLHLETVELSIFCEPLSVVLAMNSIFLRPEYLE